MKKLLFLLLLLSTSCRTIYVDRPVKTIVHDTLKIVQAKTDSVFVKDSIFVYKNGDTVFIYKYRDRYKDKIVRDTIYKHSLDSISYPVYIEKKVEVKYIPLYNKILGFLGIILIGYIIYRIYYLIKKIRQ